MGKKAFRHQPLAVRKSNNTNKENKTNTSRDIERIAAMKSRLRKGEIAEALFVAKALGLGMNVSKPFGQNCRYDFMVEVMGKASRVQVKSTWGIRNWSRRVDGTRVACPNAYIVRCGGSDTHGKLRYRPGDLDYIAAYIALTQDWYIIPLARVHKPFYIVLPGRYARYREAWDQLCPRGTVVGDIQACADPNARSLTAEDAEDAEDAETAISDCRSQTSDRRLVTYRAQTTFDTVHGGG